MRTPDIHTDILAEGAAAVLEESDYIDPCPIGGLAREVANTSEPLRLAAANVFDSWIDAATRHLVDAGVSSEQAAQLAQVFVATVEGMFVLSRTQRSTAPLHAAGRSFGQLVTQGIDEGRWTQTSQETPDQTDGHHTRPQANRENPTITAQH